MVVLRRKKVLGRKKVWSVPAILTTSYTLAPPRALAFSLAFLSAFIAQFQTYLSQVASLWMTTHLFTLLFSNLNFHASFSRVGWCFPTGWPDVNPVALSFKPHLPTIFPKLSPTSFLHFFIIVNDCVILQHTYTLKTSLILPFLSTTY